MAKLSEKLIEYSDKIAEVEQEEDDVVEEIKEELTSTEIMTSNNTYVMSEHEEITKLSQDRGINFTDAKKHFVSFPPEYVVQDQNIPDLIYKMRNSRRKLKGEYRTKMSKAIDTMIDAYSDHLQKCIESITWLNDYQIPLSKMRYNEKDLHKLNKMKSVDSRREVVDALCKYWEAEIEQNNMAYGKDYSKLAKVMRSGKRDFRECISKISNQSLVKSKKDRQNDFIVKMVCENPGINAKGIHERMPSDLFKVTNSNSISKSINKLDIVSMKGNYYKLPSMLKKNVWAYTAAFIDSDGYITVDRNMNPRVGLVATGERGKAFMNEMHKSIGFGRLHLDQKSPQDTRPVNRLNFYSQADVTALLTKCLPHFRLKKGNANLLLELIRMKKSYKKADWYKGRCDEIFKLMKWENHKDHVGFDFAKENINLDDISKLQGNCKMSVMDSLENIGGVIVKQQERTFVITEVDWDTKLEEDAEEDTVSLDFMIGSVTAKELEIKEDDTQEEIEDELSNWISMETGWLHSGFVWHEVTADGKIRDWLSGDIEKLFGPKFADNEAKAFYDSLIQPAQASLIFGTDTYKVNQFKKEVKKNRKGNNTIEGIKQIANTIAGRTVFSSSSPSPSQPESGFGTVASDSAARTLREPKSVTPKYGQRNL